MLEKDKSNEAKGEFYKYLKAFSKLVVHRKRVVRQATRKLLSYLQYWLMYLNIDNNLHQLHYDLSQTLIILPILLLQKLLLAIS